MCFFDFYFWIRDDIEFSIRAKICQSLKDIFVDKDNPWQPLVDKKGKAIDGQATFRMGTVISFL